MQARARNFLTRLLTLLLAASFALAQPNIAVAQSGSAFTQQELDQMLAPIALYPDALLSQIMMAATYPLEVVEAERWSRANPGLSGDRAVRAVERNNWDPSVKSMVAFPQILGMMSEKLDWTERLGDAFLDQESQVMDTVQYLRQQAQAAGNLDSNDNYRVNSRDGYIDIEQANPQFAYVPYYNPRVVYGAWRYPQYPPVYWSPWPGYRERPGFGTGFAWGIGIALGAEFFFGAFDWQQRHVNVVNVNNYYYPRNTAYANRAANTWQHEPEHRRGIPYRAPEVREKFSRAYTAPESRRDYRGRETPAVAQPGRTENRNDNRNDNRPDARPADTRGGPNNRQDERVTAKPAAVALPTPPEGRDGRDGRNTNTRRDDATNPKPVTTAPTPRAETRDERGSRGNERTPPQPAAPAPADQAPARNQRSDPRTAPVTAVRPAPAQAPHALEGLGRGAETRNASERGRSSSAPAARQPERVAAPPPQAAVPPTPPRATAATPPQRPATASQRENSRENKDKGRNEK